MEFLRKIWADRSTRLVLIGVVLVGVFLFVRAQSGGSVLASASTDTAGPADISNATDQTPTDIPPGITVPAIDGGGTSLGFPSGSSGGASAGSPLGASGDHSGATFVDPGSVNLLAPPNPVAGTGLHAQLLAPIVGIGSEPISPLPTDTGNGSVAIAPKPTQPVASFAIAPKPTDTGNGSVAIASKPTDPGNNILLQAFTRVAAAVVPPPIPATLPAGYTPRLGIAGALQGASRPVAIASKPMQAASRPVAIASKPAQAVRAPAAPSVHAPARTVVGNPNILAAHLTHEAPIHGYSGYQV